MTQEIFTAPKLVVSNDAFIMKQAIRSWQRLTSTPCLKLLGREVGFYEATNKLGVNIGWNIDRNFLGLPFFNSIFEKANESKSFVAIFINVDILLYQYFINVLYILSDTFQDFWWCPHDTVFTIYHRTLLRAFTLTCINYAKHHTAC